MALTQRVVCRDLCIIQSSAPSISMSVELPEAHVGEHTAATYSSNSVLKVQRIHTIHQHQPLSHPFTSANASPPLQPTNLPPPFPFPSLFLYCTLSANKNPYQTVTPNPTKFVSALTPCIRPNALFNLCISLDCGPESYDFFPSLVS